MAVSTLVACNNNEESYSASQLVKPSYEDNFELMDLNNLEEKKNAIRYFQWHYGKIDYIESNNEHYLESDAYLRSEFNVTTGPMAHEIIYFKHKSPLQ